LIKTGKTPAMRAFCFGRVLETARPDCHVILFKSQSRHSMTNLLQTFSLSHTQITRLNADLNEIVKPDQPFSTKVELKLSPREMNHEAELPQYQVTARMLCHGRKSGSESESDQPLFTIELVLQAVYSQFQGEPVSFETFKGNHGSLTRQLYPLIHHQLQPLLKQFGLNQVKLPYDLVQNAAVKTEGVSHQIH